MACNHYITGRNQKFVKILQLIFVNYILEHLDEKKSYLCVLTCKDTTINSQTINLPVKNITDSHSFYFISLCKVQIITPPQPFATSLLKAHQPAMRGAVSSG